MMVIVEMLFHKISIKDKEWYTKKIKQEKVVACDYVFASNFVWAEEYGVEVAEVEGCAVIRYSSEDDLCYSFPIGGSVQQKKQALDLLKKYCQSKGVLLKLAPITEEQKQFLLTYYPNEYEIDSDRDSFDYVYERNLLAELKGKKLAAKRNYIHRFEKEGDWEYESLTNANKEECWELELEWTKGKNKESQEEILAEQKALRNALDYFDQLGLIGGVLRQHGVVVAFCVAERLNDDMMVVHFEKAKPQVVGAFQMINQQFAQRECGQCHYINREDDAGDLGLRKAKSSYRFYQFVKKYSAIQSQYTYATKEDFPDIKRIWREAFGDEDQYISFYLENRWNEENMICMRENGRIVSFANLLPARIRIDGEMVDAYYLYAVATDIEFRGKGYATKIIGHIEKKYSAPILVVPATKELVAFYEKLGFWEAFEKESLVYSEIKSVQPLEFHECGVAQAGEFKQARDLFFDREGYVEWDVEAVAYAIKENAICEGKLIHMPDKGYVLYRKDEDILVVLESTIAREDVESVVATMMKAEQCNRAVLHNYGGMIYSNKGELKGKKKGYLNLVLGD